MSRINGLGLGLRSKYFSNFLEQRPPIAWLEIVADNYLYSQGLLLEKLQAISQHYPTVIHGLSLSIAGTDPLDKAYLQELKNLQEKTKALWISDHFCWSSHRGQYTHDLLPFPFTTKNLKNIVERIKAVQDNLQQQILLENISTYLSYREDEFFEADFIAEVAEQANCFLLLDVNNVYVNSLNHHFSSSDYFAALNKDRIKQLHLGGYTKQENLLVDTHGEAVHSGVWELYASAVEKFGSIATCIEWDNNLPEWPELWEQVQIAQKIMNELREPQTCN